MPLCHACYDNDDDSSDQGDVVNDNGDDEDNDSDRPTPQLSY